MFSRDQALFAHDAATRQALTQPLCPSTAALLFDSHCHLDFPEFERDLPAVLARARAQGVTGMVAIGVTPGQWPRLLRLATREPDVFATLGVHPWYAERVTGRDFGAVLRELEAGLSDRSVVAVGECGLDKLAERWRGVSLAAQCVVFEAQLALACKLGLPVVLHVVHAHSQVLALLRRFAPLPRSGVVHGFSGSAEVLAEYVRLGLYIGVGTAVLSAKNAKLRTAVRAAPLERLLLETDAPDRPAPGSATPRGEPTAIAQVAGEVATLRGEPSELVRRQTTLNARHLFGIPLSEQDDLGHMLRATNPSK